MRKIGLIAVIVALLLAACQSSPQEALPTLVQFPTETVTATVTNTVVPTNTPVPSDTATASATATETEIPTETQTPSETPIPTDTPDKTEVAIGTATEGVLEAPVFSTFTPVPPGAIGILVRPTSTGTPEVMADVVITVPQFQEEVSRMIADNPAINQADISFVADKGVVVKLTALSGDAFVTGTVTVPFNFSGGSFNNIVMIGGMVDIAMQNDIEPSEDFLGHVSDAVVIVQEAFNFILNQRLGEGKHNLEEIFITNDIIGVSLLVPEPGQ